MLSSDQLQRGLQTSVAISQLASQFKKHQSSWNIRIDPIAVNQSAPVHRHCQRIPKPRSLLIQTCQVAYINSGKPTFIPARLICQRSQSRSNIIKRRFQQLDVGVFIASTGFASQLFVNCPFPAKHAHSPGIHLKSAQIWCRLNGMRRHWCRGNDQRSNQSFEHVQRLSEISHKTKLTQRKRKRQSKLKDGKPVCTKSQKPAHPIQSRLGY